MPAYAEDQLVAELRAVVTELDPVPEHVQFAARNALRWRPVQVDWSLLLGSSAPDPAS